MNLANEELATDAVQRGGSTVRDNLLKEIKQLKYKLENAEETIIRIHDHQRGNRALSPGMECERYLRNFTDYFNNQP